MSTSGPNQQPPLSNPGPPSHSSFPQSCLPAYGPQYQPKFEPQQSTRWPPPPTWAPPARSDSGPPPPLPYYPPMTSPTIPPSSQPNNPNPQLPQGVPTTLNPTFPSPHANPGPSSQPPPTTISSRPNNRGPWPGAVTAPQGQGPNSPPLSPNTPHTIPYPPNGPGSAPSWHGFSHVSQPGGSTYQQPPPKLPPNFLLNTVPPMSPSTPPRQYGGPPASGQHPDFLSGFSNPSSNPYPPSAYPPQLPPPAYPSQVSTGPAQSPQFHQQTYPTSPPPRDRRSYQSFSPQLLPPSAVASNGIPLDRPHIRTMAIPEFSSEAARPPNGFAQDRTTGNVNSIESERSGRQMELANDFTAPRIPAINGKAPEIQIEFAKDILQYLNVPRTSKKLEWNPTEVQSPASDAIPIRIHDGIIHAPPASEDKNGEFRLSVGRARRDIDLEQLPDVDATAPFDPEIFWVKRDGRNNQDFVKSDERCGNVWVGRVRDRSDGTFFAIKVLTDTDDHRKEIKFCQEVAALLAKEPNEHLVRIYDTYLLKETSPKGFTGRYIPFLRMEWADGTLRHKLDQFGDADISEKQISGYLLQLLAGLKFLHAHNRVHRDLKPSNILYKDELCTCRDCRRADLNCRLILADYGLSKVVTGKDISSLGRGTNLYKAPELGGSGTLSLGSDMWSFGCIIFDVCSTGKRMAFAFDKDLDDYVKGVVTEPPQLVQADNKALTSHDLQIFNGIIRDCLSIKPHNRPSAESLSNMFQFRFSATGESSDEDE